MKALTLISGGIDSPVASYIINKKGYELIGIHFDSGALINEEVLEDVRKLCKTVNIKKLYIIPFLKPQEEVVNKTLDRYFYILTRRLMYRISEKIAEKENCKYLVTGENVNQVSSQTLENLSNINLVIKKTVLRPLLCYDKQETINIAKEIKTYENSIGPEICNFLGPKNPATKSKINIIEEEEEKLNINQIVKESIKNAKIESIC